MGKQKRREPRQFMCIDGEMHIVDRGQFIMVNDYQDLLRRYKKLLKLAHINGIFDTIDPAKKAKAKKIYKDDDAYEYAEAA